MVIPAARLAQQADSAAHVPVAVTFASRKNAPASKSKEKPLLLPLAAPLPPFPVLLPLPALPLAALLPEDALLPLAAPLPEDAPLLEDASALLPLATPPLLALPVLLLSPQASSEAIAGKTSHPAHKKWFLIGRHLIGAWWARQSKDSIAGGKVRLLSREAGQGEGAAVANSDVAVIATIVLQAPNR